MPTEVRGNGLEPDSKYFGGIYFIKLDEDILNGTTIRAPKHSDRVHRNLDDTLGLLEFFLCCHRINQIEY